MSSRRVHIIGAGMAGLSAALQITMAGEQVTLYEAAPFAGGRCRSFFDRELGCIIDNGNHLVLSGNAAVQDFLFYTGALETMSGPGAPLFPFMDLVSGERWTVDMGNGVIPWWVFNSNKRVAGTSLLDYISALKILFAKENDIVTDLCDTRSNMYRRFWEPLVVGALNTEPEMASAKLLASVFAQSFGAGGKNCIPLIPKIGLSESFINPCVELLKKKGTKIEFARRLRSMTLDQTHVRALDFIHGGGVNIPPGDWVVLALPAWITREFLPEISVPTDFRSIISAHFRVDMPVEPTGITGLVGGLAEWAFVKPGIISVTISCGERLAEYAVRDLAPLVWRDIAKLYNLNPAKVPQHRIFKEKYATFAATPEQNARRPTALTNWKNLALAGEWTATGLPSTIEGAVRSGLKAAQIVMRWAD